MPITFSAKSCVIVIVLCLIVALGICYCVAKLHSRIISGYDNPYTGETDNNVTAYFPSWFSDPRFYFPYQESGTTPTDNSACMNKCFDVYRRWIIMGQNKVDGENNIFYPCATRCNSNASEAQSAYW